MAGPNVIKIYNKEGGYLVVFKNDKTVNTGFFCADHG